MKIKDIKYHQAKFPDFPPRNATPPVVLEPWGKNLFIYNTSKWVEFRGDPRAPPSNWPEWILEKRRLSMLFQNEDPNQVILGEGDEKGGDAVRANADEIETQLCISDFRKRPQTFLNLADMHALEKALPDLMKSMAEAEKLAAELNENISVEKLASRQQVETVGDRFRTHRKGRWMKPRHNLGGRGAMTGRIRLPRKK